MNVRALKPSSLLQHVKAVSLILYSHSTLIIKRTYLLTAVRAHYYDDKLLNSPNCTQDNNLELEMFPGFMQCLPLTVQASHNILCLCAVKYSNKHLYWVLSQDMEHLHACMGASIIYLFQGAVVH